MCQPLRLECVNDPIHSFVFTQQHVAITPTALRVRFKYVSANQRQHVRLALTAYSLTFTDCC
eukprot:COSAG01_NODE_26741_length_704_cov_2.274380_2_plen_61_part_01